MTVVTEEAAFGRLRAVEATQESIETVALWILHHKDHCELIGSVWLNSFRTGTDQHRLSLFYVTNDVCQKARRKKYQQIREAFLPRILEALTLIRHDEAAKKSITRILDIWEEREVFEPHILSQFRNTLSMTFDDNSDVDEKLLLEFEPANLVRDLEKYEICEQSIERARKLLPQARFDFLSTVKESLKDRKQGAKTLREVDETCRAMSNFVSALEDQLERHHRLIGLLEQAKSFFGQQLRDATVVDDAYRKFYNGIRNVKDQLEEMQRTGAYLGASPPRDAPSPTARDDPFAEGVEQAIMELRRPGNRDIIEASDMDLDEDGDGRMHVDAEAPINTSSSFIGVVDSTEQMMQQAFGMSCKVDPRLERMQRLAQKQAMAAAGLSSEPLVFGSSVDAAPSFQPPPAAWTGAPFPSFAPPPSSSAEHAGRGINSSNLTVLSGRRR